MLVTTGSVADNFLGIDWSSQGNIFEGALEFSKDAYLMMEVNANISATGFTQCRPPGYDKPHSVMIGFSKLDGWAWCMCTRIADSPEFAKELRDNRLCMEEPYPGFLKAKYEVAFFRLGCFHPNMKHSKPKMFEHVLACPDCGWSSTYDSSG